MRVPRFELERWLATWEHKAERVIGTSGMLSQPLSALGDVSTPQLLDYGEIPGEPELVSAVADWLGVSEDRVLLTIGGTEADLLVPFTLVDSGATVLVERPTYFPLRAVPEALGARVEFMERRFEDAFKLDVDAVVARIGRGDVRLVSLTNPNNPTGQIVPAADLVRIAEACAEHDAYVMVDEIFSYLAFDPMPVAATLHDRIISTASLTKCFGLPGLRCGWALAAPDVRDQLREGKGLTSIVNPRIEQHLAVAAINQRDTFLAGMRKVSGENFARLEAFVAARPELDWVRPQAAPISAPRLVTGEDDVALCEAVLAEKSTLIAPGTYLDLPGHVRIGFGGDPEGFADGLARFGAFLDERG